jgi:hypothetical protein
VKNEVLTKVEEERNNLPQWNKGRLAELVTSCAGTAFQNTFLREIIEG